MDKWRITGKKKFYVLRCGDKVASLLRDPYHKDQRHIGDEMVAQLNTLPDVLKVLKEITKRFEGVIKTVFKEEAEPIGGRHPAIPFQDLIEFAKQVIEKAEK